MQVINARRACFVWAALLFVVQIIHAQGVFGTNLIVNGDAESGTAGTATTVVSSIPGWTRTGTANVLPYGLTGFVLLTDPAPKDHGFQYFENTYAGIGSTATLTQNIDISSGAASISGGNIKFTASGYLGTSSSNSPYPQVVFAFKNAGGQTFSTTTLGPAGAELGMSLQQQIGLVPSGAAQVTVTLTLPLGSAADSLSLVLSPLGTTPGSVLGVNLVVNGNAEAASGVPYTSTALYIPGWSTTNRVSVATYGGSGWISTSAPGPADRGVNLFCGENSQISSGSSYQDIDVSAAATLIDSGQVTYQISAWLGGLATSESPTLTYLFFDWAGNQLAPTAALGPTAHSEIELVETSHSSTLPSGTRRVRLSMSFPYVGSLADDISFTLAAPNGPPVIAAGTGVVSASAFGAYSDIAPGSWIEIYGTYLTSGTLRNNCAGVVGSCWSGADFQNNVAPTSLDGVSVSIGGQAAFIDFTSPGQIDAQVPSNAPTGLQQVTVTNANGMSQGFPIVVNPTEPGLLAPAAFVINGKQYVAALFSDGQTFALPVGAIPGVASRPAMPGDVLTIYGVGFGPVTGGFTAGAIVTAQNSLTASMQMSFGTATATPSYDGLAPSFVGLYQFNVVAPAVAANNALPFSFTLGGVKGSQTLYIAVQN